MAPLYFTSWNLTINVQSLKSFLNISGNQEAWNYRLKAVAQFAFQYFMHA